MTRSWLVVPLMISACATAPKVAAVPVDEAQPTPPTFRLPADARPISAALELTIDPDQSRFQGVARFELEVLHATQVLWLNATDLEVRSATLGTQALRVVPGGDDFVGFVGDFRPGTSTLIIRYEAGIDREKSRGVYSEVESGQRAAYTFFEAHDARRAFPCFDEPAFKIPWQLTFHVRRAHLARGNAPVLREVDEEGEMKRVELALSKPMPSYLVAFVVGPLDEVDGGTAGRVPIAVKFLLPKERSGELGWAKNVTPRVVKALEDYFDMPWPFLKLDVAVVPRFWGTMEHPGIVAMGQPLTLIRPEQDTRDRRQAYAGILAHELGHYWFGDVVTLAWWNDTWLNESMGQWVDAVITDAVEPSWHVRDEVRRAVDAMTRDEAVSAKSIRQPVLSEEDIQASFDGALTYNKGATVLGMFEHAVGPEKWRELMRFWVRTHAWGTVTAEDFIADVRSQLGATRADQLQSFLEQPGVPLVRATVECRTGGAELTFTQTRSLPPGAKDSIERQWKWPLCFRFGDATRAERACVDVEAPVTKTSVALCPTWVILNADAAGYQRSAVDGALTRELLSAGSAVARRAQPTVVEKLMLVADVTSAVERGEVGLAEKLALAPVVLADANDLVAQAAPRLAHVSTGLLDDAHYAQSLRFQIATFGKKARALGWQRQPGDSDERQTLRAMVLSVVARHEPALRAEAKRLTAKWLVDPKVMSDDLVDVMLDAATADGDASLFDTLLEKAATTTDHADRSRLLWALGGFESPVLLQRALALLLDTRFDLRESISLLDHVGNRRSAQGAMLVYLEQNLDGLLTRMRDDEASWLLGGLAESQCAPEPRERIRVMVEPRAARFAGAGSTVRQGLEASQRCIERATAEKEALLKFLRAY